MHRLRLAIARYLSISLLCALHIQALAADTVHYAYDALGRLVSASSVGQGVTYGYDAAGNLTAIAANNSPLAITALQPGSGITGTAVTITGTGFAAVAGDNVVKFKGTSATVQSASATHIVALVPPGAVSGEVSVTTVAGTAISPMAFHVDSLGPPTISGFSPAVAAPGSPVAISGVNLDTSAKVFFGAVSSPYRTASGTSLAVDVPARAESGKIEVATIHGTVRSSDDFFVVPPGLSAASIAVTGRLAFGQPRSANLAIAGQKAMLLFDGTAGQKVSLQIGPSTITRASASILAPGNVTVATSSFNSAGGLVDALVLPVSGTYAVLINPSGTAVGNPAITLHTFTDVSSGLIPGGAAVQVATTVPGQNAVLTFNGSAGQRIGALVNDVSFSGGSILHMSLRKPDGSVTPPLLVTSRGAFLEAQTLPDNGTYTLLLNPGGVSLAKASIQLYDVPPELSVPATVGGAPVQIATTVPGQNAAIVFDGVEGQRISALVNGVSFAGGNALYMSLRKPDGSVMVDSILVTSSGAFLDTQILSVSGTYALRLDPKAASLVQQTKVQLFDVPASVQVTATIGGTAAGIATTVPGQNASLTFNGNAGQSVTIAATGNTMGCVALAPRKPDGATLMTKRMCSASVKITPLVLPASGNYSVDINPDGSNIGAINIRITSP
jgi:YD repeat-containing protein